MVAAHPGNPLPPPRMRIADNGQRA